MIRKGNLLRFFLGACCLAVLWGSGAEARAGAVGEAFPLGPLPVRGEGYYGAALNRKTGGFLTIRQKTMPNSLDVGPLLTQAYDAQGHPIGESAPVDGDRVSIWGKVLADGQGRYLTTWYSYYEGEGYKLRFRFTDSLGKPLGEAVNVEEPGYLNDIAMNSAGEFVLVLIGNDQHTEWYSVKRYNASGEPQGEAVRILSRSFDDEEGYSGGMRVAMNDRGECVAAWISGRQVRIFNDSYFAANLYARRFNALGQPEGGVVPLTDDSDHQRQLLGVTLGPDGTLAAVWWEMSQRIEAAQYPSSINGQWWNPDGSVRREATSLFPMGFDSPYFQLVGEGTGAIMIVSGGYGGKVSGRWFDADGSPRGDTIFLNGPNGYSWPGAVAGDGAGNVLALWQPMRPNSGGTVLPDAYGRRFAFGTKTALSASRSPSGEYLSLTAEVRSAPGTDLPTGRITFRDGDAFLAEIPLDENGRAEYVTDSLTPGAHHLTADYASDDTYFDSAGTLEGSVDPPGTGAPLPGDVNGDGTVGVEDAVMLLRSLVGPSGVTLSLSPSADVNGDGALDVRDVVGILRLTVGLPLS